MKRISIVLFLCIASYAATAQEIKDMQAYWKLGGTRIIALTADNQPHLYTTEGGWGELPKGELPDGEIKSLGVYHQLSGSKLMVNMADNSIWRLMDEEWNKISNTGLPKDLNIKLFNTYTKYKMMGASGRALVLSEKNELWRYTEEDRWESLHQNELPSKLDIQHISSFQKIKGMGYKTSFIVGMSDQSLYKRTIKDKKWEKLECKQLPKGYQINSVESYLKIPLISMSGPEGRIIISLEDGSIWWTSEKDEYWEKLEMKGLPEGYKIKKMKVFQKTNSARVLVLLHDNTIWWYADEEGFSMVDMSGFNK